MIGISSINKYIFYCSNQCDYCFKVSASLSTYLSADVAAVVHN